MKRIDVVSGLLVNDQGEMLMQLRGPTKLRPNMWEHPGGKVEGNEPFEAALAREWREELGVDPQVGRCLFTLAMPVEVLLMMHLYTVRLDRDQVPRPLDAVSIGWFTPEHAITRLPCTPATYGYHQAIVTHLSGDRRTAERFDSNAPFVSYPAWNGKARLDGDFDLELLESIVQHMRAHPYVEPADDE